MIRVQYQSELVEQAVRTAVRRDMADENALHQAVDPLYEVPGGEARERQFKRIFADWFTRLRLDRTIDEWLSNFPLIVTRVETGLIRSAPRRKSEGAELFVPNDAPPARGALVIQICPESLVDPQPIRDAMLRELRHVEDMLDPAFNYAPTTIEGEASHQQVVRDRFRVLWDIRVEAQLAGRGLIEESAESRLRRQFERAFTFAGAAPPAAMFDAMWNDPAVNHADLFRRAANPREWFGESGHGGAIATGSAGEPCPACGFPTFDWYEGADRHDARVMRGVRRTTAHWTPEQGVCRQCAEIFLSERAERCTPPDAPVATATDR